MADGSLDRAYALALGHHRAGRLGEAEALYRRILSVDPNHADSLQMLGGIALHSGHPRQAVELISKAIALNPDSADYHSNLAIALASMGQPAGAIESLRRALALRPDYPEALYNLGKLLAQQNRIEEAIGVYGRAVGLRPGFPEAHNNLGDVLRRAGRLDEAVASLRTALSLRSNFPEALFNFGVTLEAREQFDAAQDMFDRLLTLEPDSAEAHNEMGNVLRELNRPREALDAHQRAMALRPDFVQARWQAALCHLSLGEFEEGWTLFESRRRLPEWAEARFDRPEWDGSDLAGKRLLLWAEQGLGDTIQFIRYAPLLTARGATVHLRCQPALVRMLGNQLTIESVTGEGGPLPNFDFHCPLLSLPHLLGTTLDSIPAEVPYIRPEPALVELWRTRLAESLPPLTPPPRLLVGLAWATNLLPASARKRWIDPGALSELGGIPDVRFVSLQKVPAGSGALAPSPGVEMIDFTPALSDFAETAALVANLDLVITCDTSVAHLAGAMGKAVWIGLPFAAPWRWMQGRGDSPWYPTARLFRQPEAGDWRTVVRRMKEDVIHL